MGDLLRPSAPLLVEAGSLAAAGVLFDLLAGGIGPRTGSLGEAQMVRILEAAASGLWLVALPLALGRGGAAEARRRRSGDRVPAAAWPPLARRLRDSLLAVFLGASAAVTLAQTYDVEGALPGTLLLASMVALASLLGESFARRAARRRGEAPAERVAVRRAARATWPGVAPDVEATPGLLEAIQEAWRGAAARGRHRAGGLSPLLASRSEFFADLELDLRATHAQGGSYTLLVAAAPGGEADRVRLGEEILRVFGATGPRGYLGNDLFAVGLSAAADEDVAQAAEALREGLGGGPSATEGRPAEASIGWAVSLGAEGVRDLYARALASQRRAAARETAPLDAP
ncbi:MAG: hypothetical protein AB1726_10160 [Planctomycetota bacterium]